jgi:hypothetical protein
MYLDAFQCVCLLMFKKKAVDFDMEWRECIVDILAKYTYSISY